MTSQLWQSQIMKQSHKQEAAQEPDMFRTWLTVTKNEFKNLTMPESFLANWKPDSDTHLLRLSDLGEVKFDFVELKVPGCSLAFPQWEDRTAHSLTCCHRSLQWCRPGEHQIRTEWPLIGQGSCLRKITKHCKGKKRTNQGQHFNGMMR